MYQAGGCEKTTTSRSWKGICEDRGWKNGSNDIGFRIKTLYHSECALSQCLLSYSLSFAVVARLISVGLILPHLLSGKLLGQNNPTKSSPLPSKKRNFDMLAIDSTAGLSKLDAMMDHRWVISRLPLALQTTPIYLSIYLSICHVLCRLA